VGQFGPKFQVQGVVPLEPFFCQKNRMIILSYDIIMGAEVSSVLSQFMRLSDRRTADGRTDLQRLIFDLDCMQRGKNQTLHIGQDNNV